MRRNFVLIVLMSSISCGGGPAVDISGMMALRASLQEVDSVISRGINDADVSTSNRIRQAGAELRELIDRIDELESKTATDVNDVANEVLRSSHALTQELRELVSETQSSTFLEVNKSLANLATTLDGMPLVKIPSYVASVVPTRVPSSPRDRRISIYGYFPEVRNGGNATVEILGKELPLEESTGGRLVFDLPELKLEEESFLNLVIVVSSKQDLWFWKRPRRIGDRIYVERTEPYECQLAIHEANPERVVEIRGDRRFTDRADSSDQHVEGVVSAVDLFNTTVSPARRQQLLANTAKIKEPGFERWGNAACNDHCSWTSKIHTWNENKVEYSLEAENCSSHWHGALIGGYQHGGGGGHANIGLTPTFQVIKKDVPEHIVVEERSFRLGRGASFDSEIIVPDDWKIHVTCDFRDGSEEWSSGLLALSPQDSEEQSQGLVARYADGRVIVRSSG